MDPVSLVFILLGALLVLFSTEWLSVDVTALLLIAALMLSGLLSPEEALAGFGDATVLTLAALFILAQILVRSGVIRALVGVLAGPGGRRPGRSSEGSGRGLIQRLLSGVTAVSTVTSNTATTAVFLPVMYALSRRTGEHVGRVMMPLAFASILGGSITLIGTSTNLVVSGFLPQLGLEPLGFFELAWVGVPLAVAGLLYLFFVAPRLLPTRESEMEQQVRAYISDLTVAPDSPLVGQTLAQSRLGSDYGLMVVVVRRGERTIYAPEASFRIELGDTLALESDSEGLLAAQDALGLVSRSAEKLSLSGLESEVRLVETVVMPGNELIGRTLREARFRERYGLSVLALHRREKTVERLGGLRVRVGDVLLIQGPETRLRGLGDAFAVLADLTEQQPDGSRAPLAALLFVGALVLAATGLVPLVVALISAVALALALRLISPAEAYRSIEWPVLVLVAAMLAFGAAFQSSGAAEQVAGWLAGTLEPLGGLGALAGVYLFTVLLTQPMSNQAAALVMLPLAVGVAGALGYDPRPFAVTVALAASNSFLTPLEPSCMLVYGPGHYRFADFVRVGGGLTLLTFVLTMLIVPLVWPLTS
ncbi:SLC13 family permease [Deinococcus radiophilus]|uniref:SLC13 family permease n=1 Tax=Deinococcus radiophilus TaxID=32062 RepID=A0A431W0S9_9DEIO|nr:SLC13 family permease [Deinococcus radiophilus]RTR29025.1 SLC13 family permease [Deinococcus radiophilus]UFA49611.1 anion permease [Deinococcus radiophilus]